MSRISRTLPVIDIRPERVTPITEILQNCTWSMDFKEDPNWAQMISEKSGAYSGIDSLHPDDFDPNFITLLESIMEFGIRHPVMWSASEKTYRNGHHRLTAAILLGLDEVPTTEDYDAGWVSVPYPRKGDAPLTEVKNECYDPNYTDVYAF